MGTHALIGIQNKDRSVNWIYQHTDGHPYGTGHALYYRWNTEPLVRALINSGGIYHESGTVQTVTDFPGREEYTYLWRGGQWYYHFKYQNLRQDGTLKKRKVLWHKLKCEIVNSDNMKPPVEQGAMYLAKNGQLFG